MTETLNGMSLMPKAAKKSAKPVAAERAAVRELVTAARARGEGLAGPEGLLKTITATAAQAGVGGGDDRASGAREAPHA